MFTETQKTELDAPLNAANVKGRKQGGRMVSYIEGWHAIAEANRIFGFDGWSRETIETKCVSEKGRFVGTDKHDGWGVTYVCRVRITVGEIIRDGCGTGHGIDRDLGQAHESAIKEAETDAMKRAFMTFGNQFGLALYDKEQTNVERTPAKPSITAAASELHKVLQTEMYSKNTVEDLKAWVALTTVKAQMAQLPINLLDSLRLEYTDTLAALKAPADEPAS